ncbi:MAG TPA: ABC transporter ATP-binding protein [Thermoleophilia bacterium]|nr:ABC transporter ATP-binding protein [Thermoleophilia bacterium]HET6476505.1 ABC transporter ATP-binding protein [Thermoleophilia bacterium]
MSLEAQVALHKGALHLEADLAIADDQVVVLLGPNAAGKTTLLRALAGLIPLESGKVVLDGRVLEDVSAGVRVPPEHRPVGVVFQDYLLFPHLNVLENVAFGLRARGLHRRTARRVATEWLERVDLAACAMERPKALSGGQAQRAALARALATDPRLLLLDEPLSAMDAGARAELRRELNRHLGSYSGTCLLVTHDPIEAMTLADLLVVLEDGRVVQVGSPAELSAHPRSRYVADLVGLNLYRGQGAGHVVELPAGQRIVTAETVPQEGDVFAVIPPGAVALHRAHPEGSRRNVWAGTAGELDVAGERIRVHVSGPMPIVAEVTPAAVAALHLGEGGAVYASVKATEIVTYPA